MASIELSHYTQAPDGVQFAIEVEGDTQALDTTHTRKSTLWGRIISWNYRDKTREIQIYQAKEEFFRLVSEKYGEQGLACVKEKLENQWFFFEDSPLTSNRVKKLIEGLRPKAAGKEIIYSSATQHALEDVLSAAYTAVSTREENTANFSGISPALKIAYQQVLKKEVTHKLIQAVEKEHLDPQCGHALQNKIIQAVDCVIKEFVQIFKRVAQEVKTAHQEAVDGLEEGKAKKLPTPGELLEAVWDYHKAKTSPDTMEGGSLRADIQRAIESSRSLRKAVFPFQHLLENSECKVKLLRALLQIQRDLGDDAPTAEELEGFLSAVSTSHLDIIEFIASQKDLDLKSPEIIDCYIQGLTTENFCCYQATQGQTFEKKKKELWNKMQEDREFQQIQKKINNLEQQFSTACQERTNNKKSVYKLRDSYIANFDFKGIDLCKDLKTEDKNAIEELRAKFQKAVDFQEVKLKKLEVVQNYEKFINCHKHRQMLGGQQFKNSLTVSLMPRLYLDLKDIFDPSEEGVVQAAFALARELEEIEQLIKADDIDVHFQALCKLEKVLEGIKKLDLPQDQSFQRNDSDVDSDDLLFHLGYLQKNNGGQQGPKSLDQKRRERMASALLERWRRDLQGTVGNVLGFTKSDGTLREGATQESWKAVQDFTGFYQGLIAEGNIHENGLLVKKLEVQVHRELVQFSKNLEKVRHNLQGVDSNDDQFSEIVSQFLGAQKRLEHWSREKVAGRQSADFVDEQIEYANQEIEKVQQQIKELRNPDLESSFQSYQLFYKLSALCQDLLSQQQILMSSPETNQSSLIVIEVEK